MSHVVERKPKPPRRSPETDYNANHIQLLNGRNSGSDIYVVGTGTSLTGFDWTRLSGRITIALNDAVKVGGFEPTYHLWSDGNLFKARFDPESGYRPGGFGHWPYGSGTSVVCQRAQRAEYIKGQTQPVEILRRIYQFCLAAGPENVKLENDELYVNRTVATGGIQLAWRLGAHRIVLLGVDAYKIRVDGSRDIYYHDGTGKPKEKRKERVDGTRVIQDRHDLWIKQMADLRLFFYRRKLYPGPWPGSGIYQTSLASPIDAWQKIPIEEVLR